MYRAPSKSREATVAYGPFPMAWWKLAAAPGVWLVAFFVGGLADVRQQIDCSERGCEVVARGWRRPVVRRAGDRGLVVRAEVVGRRRNKGGETAQASVVLSTGGAIALERETAAIAERQVGEVMAFVGGQAREFHHDSGDRRWLTPVSWLLYLGGVGLIVDAVRRRRALTMRVGGGAVTVEERTRGGGLETRTVAFEEGSDVKVEWHLLRAAGARSPERWGATLTLVARGRPEVALTTVPREGVMAHYDAAAALSEALGGARRPPSRCPDGAWSTWGGEGAVGVVSSAWLGVGCGSLAGMALYAVVRVAIDPGALGHDVGPDAMVAAAVGAVGLAALLVAIRKARERERERHRRLAAGR